jgi:hypothetical protein
VRGLPGSSGLEVRYKSGQVQKILRAESILIPKFHGRKLNAYEVSDFAVDAVNRTARNAPALTVKQVHDGVYRDRFFKLKASTSGRNVF